MQISSSVRPSALHQGPLWRRLSLHRRVLFLLVTTYVFFLFSLSPLPSSASGLFGQEGDDDRENSREGEVNGGRKKGEPLEGETPLDPEDYSGEEKPDGVAGGGWLEVLNSFMNRKEVASPAASGTSAAGFLGKKEETARASSGGSSGKVNADSSKNKPGEGQGAEKDTKPAATSDNAAAGGQEGADAQSPLFVKLASLLNMVITKPRIYMVSSMLCVSGFL